MRQLDKGQKVYSKTDKKYYTVENSHAKPRSYILKSDDGNYKRRNRRDLISLNYGNPIAVEVPTAHPVQLKAAETSTVKSEVLRRSARTNKGVLPARYRQ